MCIFDEKVPNISFFGIPKIVENPLPPLPHPSAGSSQDVLGGQVCHLGATWAGPRASLLENDARGSEMYSKLWAIEALPPSFRELHCVATQSHLLLHLLEVSSPGTRRFSLF